MHCNHICRIAIKIPIKVRAIDPEGGCAPAIPAALGPAHGSDGLRRQRDAFPGHFLHALQHGCRPRSDRWQVGQHAGELARAGHRALNAPDRAEVALDPFAHHGIGDLPDVEFWIEPARDPFDHHHGLLQQDQFGPGLHVEKAGDLEQQGQQLRHRDFFGRAVMDRLADRTNGLREILHRMMARDIAGLEMHFGNAAIVAGNKAKQDFREETPLLQAEPAHDAKIHRYKPAGLVEEQIAGMHVGMEEAVAQRVTQKALDHLAAEVGQIDLRLREPRVVVQRNSVDPLHRQHVMGGAVPVDRRHAEIRIVAGVFRHLGKRRRLQPQIHFHRDRARHGVDDFDQPQPARFGGIGFRLVGDKEEIAEVAVEARGDIGPEHLDRHRLAHAVAHHLAAMHLRDRGGGHRRPQARKCQRHRTFQRQCDRGFGFRL